MDGLGKRVVEVVGIILDWLLILGSFLWYFLVFGVVRRKFVLT